ncbi:MAG: PTS sugar transporter subunit IIA [Erysipelotrichales bacterium]|nr:PTS sugar transporter subunit IIA [Erysipelotrichales bacterium]MBQ1385980.1 PTS sugar transporter subunit IIA [Erysipelotrichales bacterium]MBQ2309630.1 PTS sugar transporter subunit IIA [Erysipelotrichales bacterium]MBQ2479416.1 PTS sugar transporter subunit IIA [Erysipelotrichales bacterium]MBQ4374548.1 PTS sugar transporter subunit IIA [Erysipelotrichales bacterium]
MTLLDILNPNIIDLEVEGTTKDEVLHHMANDLYKDGYIDDIEQFVKDIYEREAEGPTGMGSQISIPHGKSLSVRKIGIAIGRTLHPIRWESSMTDDGFQDTRLIFLFCVSADNEFARNHMLLLSELAGKLGNDARVAKLSEAVTKEEIIHLLTCDDSEFEDVKPLEEEEIVDLELDF